MKCDNLFCVYQKDGTCILKDIELDISGVCQSCIYLNIPEETVLRLIEQKQKELSKLNKRLHNLIEMRADGEITKDVFKDKKDEIEQRIATIQKELDELQPQEPPVDDASHDEKITLLKYYLEQSVNPDDDQDIPDDVIKAFVTKVVVHESSFDWYLRFSPDKTPHSLGVDGRRKNTAKIAEFVLYTKASEPGRLSVRFSAQGRYIPRN